MSNEVVLNEAQFERLLKALSALTKELRETKELFWPTVDKTSDRIRVETKAEEVVRDAYRTY